MSILNVEKDSHAQQNQRNRTADAKQQPKSECTADYTSDAMRK